MFLRKVQLLLLGNSSSNSIIAVAYLAYMRSVHGSIELGKRNAKSPSAIITVVRTTMEVSGCCNTVKSKGRSDSHTTEEVHIYLHMDNMDVSRNRE